MTIFPVFGAKYRAPFKSFVARQRYKRCDHFHHNGELIKKLTKKCVYLFGHGKRYPVSLEYFSRNKEKLVLLNLWRSLT